MQLADMQLPHYACLPREDIVAVDVAARSLVLPAGPISFSGKDIALCFPDCPAAGLSFDAASCLYKKEALVKELQLSKNGNRCAEVSIPNAKFKELVTRRYEMLKGEKLFGFMPWYIVSAAYTEYAGTGVNWADEVAGRMLEALLAFKHGGKKLKFEAEILKHVSLQLSKLYDSGVSQAPQLVTPGEEQVVEELVPGMEFREPDVKKEGEVRRELEVKREPELELETKLVEEILQEKATLQGEEVLPEQEVLQEQEVLLVQEVLQEQAVFREADVLPEEVVLHEEVVLREAVVVQELEVLQEQDVFQDQELLLEQEALQERDGSLADNVRGFGEEEDLELSVAKSSKSAMVWVERPDQGEALLDGGVEDVGLDAVKICAFKKPMENGCASGAHDDGVAVEVHLSFPLLPFSRGPTTEEPVHVEVLQLDTSEQGEGQSIGGATSNVSASEKEVVVQDSTCLKEQDLNTAAADLGGVRTSVDVVASCEEAAKGDHVRRKPVVRHARKRVQTRSTSGAKLLTRALYDIQDRCRTKQEGCKQLEAAIQEKEHQKTVSHKDKLKLTLTDLHTTIRANEDSLRQARKEQAKLVLRHNKLKPKLREVVHEEKELRKQFLQARDMATRHMAERDRALADGMKEMQALQAIKLVKVAQMHVKRRKMEEENVSVEERESSNKAQIWELEKALVDQGQSGDALWEQWRTQNLRCEQLMADETRVEKCLLESSQILAQLHEENAKLAVDLKKQEAYIAELESKYSQVKGSKELAEYELQVGNNSVSVPQSPNSQDLEPPTGQSKRKGIDMEREHKRRNQDTEREMANVWQRVKDEESVWTKRSARGLMGVKDAFTQRAGDRARAQAMRVTRQRDN